MKFLEIYFQNFVLVSKVDLFLFLLKSILIIIFNQNNYMKTLAEFNDDKGFNLKLTEDKVYVSAVGNEETFALRSVNGVGLYDNIEKYNEELEAFKKKYSKTKVIVFYSFAALFFIVGILAAEEAAGGREADDEPRGGEGMARVARSVEGA